MQKRIRDTAPIDRPREKLCTKGVKALSDVELLAVMIGSGTAQVGVEEIATSLLQLLSRQPLDTLTLETLTSIPGISTAKGAALLATLELTSRNRHASGYRIIHARDILPLCTHIRDKKQEHLLSITLDGAQRLVEKRTITIGTLTASLIHPREVFADAIAERAASMFLVHNHPSGSLEPSAKDREVTTKLARIGMLLGIPIRDHIIVTRNGYCSMAARGLLPVSEDLIF